MVLEKMRQVSRNVPGWGLLAGGPLAGQLRGRAGRARFLAGTNSADAVGVGVQLTVVGLQSCLDYLAPEAATLVQARTNRDVHRHTLRLLSDAGLVGVDSSSVSEVMVRLPDIGLALGRDGDKIAVEHAHDICVSAAEVGTSVTFDIQGQDEVDPTLAVLEELRPDFPFVGVGLSAALRRTEADCRALSGPGCRVRLRKGAPEPGRAEYFTDRSEVDHAFARCLNVLLAGDGYPMVATHDPRLLRITDALAARYGRTPGSYEFQTAYGVRSREHLRRARRGDVVRVNVPYGDPGRRDVLRGLTDRPMDPGALLLRMTSSG
jgi:proline dehydrogenase